MLGLTGTIVFGYSLLTDYELGIVRALPLCAHLILDIVSGTVLILLPLIIGMAGDVPHFFICPGLFALASAFITKTKTGRDEFYE